MNDLINRKAVLDVFDCSIGGVPADSVKYVAEYANKMEDRIKHIPTAQPEIIRCKGCCHYPGEYADCPMIGWARNENDFCSYAERREE